MFYNREVVLTLEEENNGLWELLNKTLEELKWSMNSSHGLTIEEIYDWLNERMDVFANPSKPLLAMIDDINHIYESWEDKYDMIFDYAPRIRKIVHDLELEVEYFDPNSTHEEDITAYVNALNELKNNIAC